MLIIFNTYYNFEMKSSSIQKAIELEGEIKKYEFDKRQFIRKNVDLKERYINANRELKLLIKYTNSLNRQIKENNTSQHKIYKDILNFNSHSQTKNRRNLDSLNNIVFNANKIINYQAIEIATKKKIIQNENSKILKYSLFLNVGSILGFILASYGFYNWRKLELLRNN
ncbi:MAG: hypothetical protein CFE24_11695 [Flavobacterium sp. BFFFF2]|nr:MAG: hypothetical protein CFE24_11695 [Flavobacterium sp. BFFFF2]